MPDTISAPYECPRREVEKAWIDANGHMNMAYYHLVFDEALDQIFNEMDIGWDYTNAGIGSTFTGEVHVLYRQELNLGDPIRITYQLVDWDKKRLHLFGRMYHGTENFLAATSEQMCLHVSLETRRVCPFPEDKIKRISAIADAHSQLDRPEELGRVMAIRR